ncbi:hypothetical protein CLBP1_5.8 [Escherichia phage CLB_P1]|uniref:Uncharacterized protein n=1 Tax=Escherichia phage CLB_P1 TaxID=1262524 RepID=A0A7I6H9S8_9CAUD|nr:hypothetical protein CLBP1_5.8 [Escherichia phage CLB_P1]
MSELDLLKKFDELMSHLNGEENPRAEEFREALWAKLDSAADDKLWRECLESGGVDNWSGFSESLSEGGYYKEYDHDFW